ncbi:AzlD family protein [Klebsiella sp. WOUb02]|uniref:AzlD family protein n=1 Tax=Klebsiella sp. WOUb02 TaxID=3161071 RepID=UPI003CF8F9AE
MNVEMSDAGALIIIIAMALVTLATRWGGVYVMSFVPFSGKIKSFIQAMSGSVLVAIIAPTAVCRRQRRPDGVADNRHPDAGA